MVVVQDPLRHVLIIVVAIPQTITISMVEVSVVQQHVPIMAVELQPTTMISMVVA